MALKEIHDEMLRIAGSSPALGIAYEFWAEVLAAEVKRNIKSWRLSDRATPLKNILADIELDANAVSSTLHSHDEIRLGNLRVKFDLKVEGASEGILSSHQVTLTNVKGSLSVRDGIVSVTSKENQYDSKPPNIKNPYRETHLDTLVQKHGWSRDEVDYFTRLQEPAAAMLVANDLYPHLLPQLKLLDLAQLFPSLQFSGSFLIDTIASTQPQQKIIVFVPTFVVRKDLDECTLKEIQQRLIGGTTTVRGRETVTVSARPVVDLNQYKRKPVGDDLGEVYVYLPKEASAELFDPIPVLERSRQRLVSTGDSWEIPPFLVTHAYELLLQRSGSLSWRPEGPILDFTIGISSRLLIDIDLKLLKLRTDLFKITQDFSHTIVYSAALVGDGNVLRFIGELYDPTNFDAHVKLEIPGVGGDAQRILEWLLNAVCVPILRLLVTYILAVVTWPLIAPLLPAIAGGTRAPPNMQVKGYTRGTDNDVTIAMSRRQM